MISKFNGFYWRNKLSKTNDGSYVVNLDEYKPIGTHWIVLYLNGNNFIHFGRFGVEHIWRKRVISNKNIKTNVYRIRANVPIMCGYFCIGFIDFMLKSKSWLDYTNLFSPNEHEKNDKTKLLFFL